MFANNTFAQKGMTNRNLGKSKQKGFTLIEVLIAFIILAVGLLGIVSLQAMSKKFTHQAAQRTLAVSFADSIVERIRANPSALITYTNSGNAGAATVVGGTTIAVEPAPNCMSSICSTVQMAAHDLWELEQSLDGATIKLQDNTNTSGLIEPKICFNFTARAGMVRTGFLTVRLQWTGLNELSDAVTVNGTNCDPGKAPNTDNFRRQVVVNTYVIDEGEL